MKRMFKTKVSIIVASHLSDVQETLGHASFAKTNANRINFVKWLMLEHSDMNQDIDADEEYERFIQAYPQWAI